MYYSGVTTMVLTLTFYIICVIEGKPLPGSYAITKQANLFSYLVSFCIVIGLNGWLLTLTASWANFAEKFGDGFSRVVETNV